MELKVPLPCAQCCFMGQVYRDAVRVPQPTPLCAPLPTSTPHHWLLPGQPVYDLHAVCDGIVMDSSMLYSMCSMHLHLHVALFSFHTF